MIVTGDGVAQFVAERVGKERFYPPFTTLGIERDGVIVAGVVFNSFQNGVDIAATVAGEPGAFTRGFIETVGLYVFGQLGCLRISITTEQPKVIAIARRLGGTVEGVKRDAFGAGRDGTMIGILKRDWRYGLT